MKWEKLESARMLRVGKEAAASIDEADKRMSFDDEWVQGMLIRISSK
jgi:hypothetical protein